MIPSSSTVRLLSCLGLATVAGCGPAPPHEQGAATTAGGEALGAPEPEGSIDDYEARIDELSGKLSQHLAPAEANAYADHDEALSAEEEMAPAPEPARAPTRCETAFDLRDRICDLAGRICALANENPGEDSLRQRCEAASGACDQARADVEAACGS